MTAREGIFATGTATGPMDIVDSILTAGAAAAEAAAYLQKHVICPTSAAPTVSDRREEPDYA